MEHLKMWTLIIDNQDTLGDFLDLGSFQMRRQPSKYSLVVHKEAWGVGVLLGYEIYIILTPGCLSGGSFQSARKPYIFRSFMIDGNQHF